MTLPGRPDDLTADLDYDRYVCWDPAPDPSNLGSPGPPVERRTVREIIELRRRDLSEMNYRGPDLTDRDVLLDFMAVYWAWLDKDGKA